MLEYRIGEKQTIQFRNDMILIIDEVDDSASILRINASVRSKLVKAIENAINITKVTRFAIGSISVSVYRDNFINFLFRSRSYSLKMSITTSDVLEILLLYSPGLASKYDPEDFSEEEEDDEWEEEWEDDDDYGDEDEGEDYRGQLLHPTFDDLGVHYQKSRSYGSTLKAMRDYNKVPDGCSIGITPPVISSKQDAEFEILPEKIINLNHSLLIGQLEASINNISLEVDIAKEEIEQHRKIIEEFEKGVNNESSRPVTETEKTGGTEEESRESYRSENIIDLG